MTLHNFSSIGSEPRAGEVYADGRCSCCTHHIYIVIAVDTKRRNIDLMYMCKCHYCMFSSLQINQVKYYHQRLF